MNTSLGTAWDSVFEYVVRRVALLRNARKRLAEQDAAKGKRAFDENQFDEATRWYSSAVSLDSGNFQHLLSLGQAYYFQERYDEAENCFRRILNLNFNHRDAISWLGYTLHTLSFNKQSPALRNEAIYWYFRSLEISNLDVKIHSNLIVALYDNERYEDAISAGERALDLSLDDGMLRLYLAYAYYIMGNIETATVHSRRALELNPNSAAVHRLLGDLARTREDYGVAGEYFQKAVELDSKDMHALLQLGIVHWKLGRTAEFLKESQRARVLAQANSDSENLKLAYWNEGWAHYILGNWRESIQASENALEIDDKVATLHFNLGLALLHVGESTRARFEYDRGLGLNDVGALTGEAIPELQEALAKSPDLDLAAATEILNQLQEHYARTTQELHDKALARGQTK